MGCAFHCSKLEDCCDNNDVLVTCAWTNALLTALMKTPAVRINEVIQQCHQTHYDALDMDTMLKPFCGHPEAFYQFLRDTWNWVITVDSDGNHILVDENKPECVCPLVRTGAASSPNLCQCSKGFAEHMFTKVLQRPVTARIRESILQGSTHCVYEIVVNPECITLPEADRA